MNLRQYVIEKNIDEDALRYEDGKWLLTNEFIAGGFAGRAFMAERIDDVAWMLIGYFTEHIGHKSIVGQCVSDCGWPDIEKMEEYFNEEAEEDVTS